MQKDSYSKKDKMKYYQKKYNETLKVNSSKLGQLFSKYNIDTNDFDINLYSDSKPFSWIGNNKRTTNFLINLFSKKPTRQTIYKQNYYYYRSQGHDHKEAMSHAAKQTNKELTVKIN